MKPFITILLAILSITGFAQYNNMNSNIRVYADPGIDRLAKEYQEIASQIHYLDGYRIQIFFDSGNLSKRNASKAREDFILQFPDVEAYITFREPYYRVRIGDFRTKLEADGFRKRILHQYPHAFTVNDQINSPSIN
ncbi:MAG: SPOR domain-containing protein [Bacteroidales bacterium]|jgi:hypothetical protein|nr:SPOR domain-containing protein [Bacteroidales bacterium]